jgi:hypothetical protein
MNVVGDLVARGKIHAAALERFGRVLLEIGYCPSSSSGMPCGYRKPHSRRYRVVRKEKWGSGAPEVGHKATGAVHVAQSRSRL